MTGILGDGDGYGIGSGEAGVALQTGGHGRVHIGGAGFGLDQGIAYAVHILLVVVDGVGELACLPGCGEGQVFCAHSGIIEFFGAVEPAAEAIAGTVGSGQRDGLAKLGGDALGSHSAAGSIKGDGVGITGVLVGDYLGAVGLDGDGLCGRRGKAGVGLHSGSHLGISSAGEVIGIHQGIRAIQLLLIMLHLIGSIRIGFPNRLIGQALGRHHSDRSNLPAYKGIAGSGHILGSNDLGIIEHILHDGLCAGIVQIEGQLMLDTAVIDLDDGVAAAVHRCLGADNALDGHILEDDGVGQNIFLVSGCCALDDQIAEIFLGKDLAGGGLILDHMLKGISAVSLLDIVLDTVLGILLLGPYCGIGQVLGLHRRSNLCGGGAVGSPAKEGVALHSHMGRGDGCAVLQVIGHIRFCGHIHTVDLAGVEGHGMTLQGIVITDGCTAVGLHLQLGLGRSNIACVDLGFGGDIGIGSAGEGLGLEEVVLAGTEILRIMLHSIGNICTGCPFCIDIDILIGHNIGIGIGDGQCLIGIPACEGIAQTLRIGRLLYLLLKVFDGNGHIAAAIGIGYDQVAVTEVIPIQGDGPLDGLGAEGHRLLAPGDDHFTGELHVVLIRVDSNGIGGGIVGELGVGHRNGVVFSVTEVAFLFGVVPIVIDGIFAFACDQVQVVHIEEAVGQLYKPDELLQLNFRNILLGHIEVQHIITAAGLVKEPFLIQKVCLGRIPSA